MSSSQPNFGTVNWDGHSDIGLFGNADPTTSECDLSPGTISPPSTASSPLPWTRPPLPRLASLGDFPSRPSTASSVYSQEQLDDISDPALSDDDWASTPQAPIRQALAIDSDSDDPEHTLAPARLMSPRKLLIPVPPERHSRASDSDASPITPTHASSAAGPAPPTEMRLDAWVRVVPARAGMEC